MPVIGLLLGARLSTGVGSKGQLVAGLVLIAIGAYTIVETRRETKDLKIPVRRRTIVLLAVALSLDNLVVGLGLGLLHAPVIVAALFMGDLQPDPDHHRSRARPSAGLPCRGAQ